MTGTFLFLFVLLGPALALGGEAIMPHLPDLYSFRYSPVVRDPFNSAETAKTLVGHDIEVDSSFGSKAAQRYLQTLVQAIKNEFFVEGVSTGDEGTHDIALINGIAFAEGEKIPVTISENDLIQLAELARTYGLPLERDRTEKNTILLAIGSIDSTGVAILLPGFKAPLCKLPYVGDTAEERITLERKKRFDHDQRNN
jgi:hypothetical protein